MKYHALFVIFEKGAKLKLASAANCRWRFMVNVHSPSWPETEQNIVYQKCQSQQKTSALSSAEMF